jgi:hypothetical protein
VSFLIDPALLYANGQAYARLAPEPERPERATLFGAVTVGYFWLVSVAMYLNRDWTLPMTRLLRASDGRDWMLNSGVFRFDQRKAGGRTHALAVLLFLTYPLWLLLGYQRGLRARESQG